MQPRTSSLMFPEKDETPTCSTHLKTLWFTGLSFGRAPPLLFWGGHMEDLTRWQSFLASRGGSHLSHAFSSPQFTSRVLCDGSIARAWLCVCGAGIHSWGVCVCLCLCLCRVCNWFSLCGGACVFLRGGLLEGVKSGEFVQEESRKWHVF